MEGHAVGLVVASGGEDQSLATQIFISAGGDVILDGLASSGFVDAKGGVLLGGRIYFCPSQKFGNKRTKLINVFCLGFLQVSVVGYGNKLSVFVG